jgi:anaerobic magnesium-protoporphyrin IX monomethyl ester cyclase
MTPDIVLSHGCILAEDEKERQIMAPYPPLGLLYVAAFLKRAGTTVEVLDSTFSTKDDIETRLRQLPASVLGLYTTSMTRSSVVGIATHAATLGWIVVVGGPDAGFHADQYLDHGAHVVVIGEGEQTVLEVLDRLATGGPHLLQGVSGTVFRDASGQTIRNSPRPHFSNLDALPFPAREMIDMEAYLGAWRTHHGHGPISVVTSRGCAYHCDWCSHAVFGHTHRRRSPGNCADEVEGLIETYEPDRLWYADDVFTIHHGWLREYATELEKRSIHLPFETITRADRFLDSDTAKTLAEMGCTRLWLGAESGSDRLLKAMGRGVTAAQIIEAARLVRACGIDVGLFLMWGYEDERLADMEATVEMVRQIRPDRFLTTVAYPIPGTGYWKKVQGRVDNPKPWAETSDRENRVEGQPHPRHFRMADTWLRPAADDLEEEAAAAHAQLVDERRKLGLEP